MKTLGILLLFLSMAIPFIATASPEGRLIVRIEKTGTSKTIKVQLANLANKRTGISLVDTKGVRWFFESVSKQTGYATHLKLDGVPDGDYIILISCRDRQHAQAFTLSEEGIDLFMAPESSGKDKSIAILASNPPVAKGNLLSHFHKGEGQQVSIQLANLLEKPATISLVSPSAGMMKQKSVTGQRGYHENWNLKGLANGNYFFCIQSESTTVIQFLKLTADGIGLTEAQRIDQPVAEEQAVLSVR